jgi:hypothetical protein
MPPPWKMGSFLASLFEDFHTGLDKLGFVLQFLLFFGLPRPQGAKPKPQTDQARLKQPPPPQSLYVKERHRLLPISDTQSSAFTNPPPQRSARPTRSTHRPDSSPDRAPTTAPPAPSEIHRVSRPRVASSPSTMQHRNLNLCALSVFYPDSESGLREKTHPLTPSCPSRLRG